MKDFTVKDITKQVIVAAMYVALVFAFYFLSFDFIQFRIAEVLLILVLFNSKYTVGLLLGTFLANLASPFGIIDATFGSLASLVAILFMILFKKIWWVSLVFPALSNAIIIPIVLIQVEFNPGMPILEMFQSSLYWANFGWVFLGEFVVLYCVGIPLYYTIKRNDHLLELIQ
ncbi:conserved hypothetical protein (DUF988) [Alteracholeplasma palmae J233]|uniref:QueT transporter family protein n=1 Tax=Alteracholeplasma palmae (strain ATCC 49389 / J233) TaxID=1318466 RepID=U4KQ84_ALTPJ|nr:QueT transporter family protein [Alteracholeplasma palmae]CCV64440.1 conserved hypothetical protein (DUF988) [Alteracholeplasma palmae J233]